MNMADFYFSAEIDSETTICISPLTNRTIELSGQEFDDCSGYFLYTTQSGPYPKVNILARVQSEEAIWHLRGMLSLN